MEIKPDVHVAAAEGFAFSERLEAANALAFKVIQHGTVQRDGSDEAGIAFKVFVSRADSADRREIFDEGRLSLNCPLVWSPDGRTVYEAHDQIYAIDVATGASQAISRFPEDERFGARSYLQCSPDGSTLFFRQSVRDGAGSHSCGRLCMMGTDGKDFRVVQSGWDDRKIQDGAIHWATGNIIFTVAYTAQDGRLTAEYYIAEPAGAKPRLIAGNPDSIGHLALSPDGHTIAIPATDKLRLISVDGVEIASLPVNAPRPAWSPDGKQIAFTDTDSGLCLVDIASGSVSKCVWFTDGESSAQPQGADGLTWPLTWSPEGRLLWFRISTKRYRTRLQAPSVAESFRGAITYDESAEAQRDREFQRHALRQISEEYKVAGIVDFAERKVWLTDEPFRDVAWSTA